MRKYLAVVVSFMLISCGGPEPSTDNVSRSDGPDYEQYWVVTDRADRRTCPSDDCGEVGRLFSRESARVLETQGDWVRITEPYDASCVGGRSEFVETGNANCAPENGIENGQFVEWVKLESLSQTRPADPAETATADESIIAQSDDFETYRAEFITAANQLIQDGTCRADEFVELGGWVKSVTGPYRDRPVYFTYCGGSTIANRIYLDVSDGRIFR